MALFRITPSKSVFTHLVGDNAFDGDSAGRDQLVVDPGAFLITTGRDAHAALLAPTGAWSVTIDGSVVSDQYFGIVLEAGNAESSTITIGLEGEISGSLPALHLLSSATVVNHGLIGSAGASSGGIRIEGEGSRIITNTGTIEGSIYVQDGLSQDQVTNSGAVNRGVGLGGGDDRLVNSGRVGQVDLSDGADTLTNSGLIGGGASPVSVYLGAGADVFTNYATVDGVVVSGTVTRWIDLGDGNDRFDGGATAETLTDGKGADIVALGAGDDRYIATGANAGNGGGDVTDRISGGAGVDTYDASSSSSSLLINLDTVAHDLSPIAAGSNRLAGGKVIGTAVAGADSDRISGFENAKGGSAGDILYGSGAANVLEGNEGVDYLLGYAGNDTLNGGGAVDVLVGGRGRDVLIGGAAADTFVFASIGDSGRTAATRDLITDFEDGRDIIALQRIDAIAGTAAGDAFTFIGSNMASSGRAGELRSYYTAAGQVAEGDVNGDGLADFSIALRDPTHSILLTAADFVL